MVRRGEVDWVNLDSTVGTEIRKTRPGLIVSPDDMNPALPRVIVAPLTSKGQPLGCRPEVTVAGKQARILLDQIHCIDKIRLAGKIGEIDLPPVASRPVGDAGMKRSSALAFDRELEWRLAGPARHCLLFGVIPARFQPESIPLPECRPTSCRHDGSWVGALLPSSTRTS